VAHFQGVDSEVGRLRTVLVHRPGPELRRVAPQHAERLLFGALPWAERAQQEHDTFTDVLRSRGVAVLYLTELLQDTLEYASARQQAAEAMAADPRLGDELRGQLRRHLDGLHPEAFAELLIMGLAPAEFRNGRGAVFGLLGAYDFIIDPLPNLVFARDASVWLGDRVAITSPQDRRAEAELASVVFGYHPLFAGAKQLYEPSLERLAGGDVLLLAPGVVAIGTGTQTSAAGMERLASRLFDAGLAHTVLAVLTDRYPGEHLDTLCTMAGQDTVVMRPALAYSLTARIIAQGEDGLRLSHRRPFLEAAAEAIGVSQLKVIETGMGGQWDDAANLLVLAPGLVVSFERNELTNARLEAAGLEVLRIPGSELAGRRGGPRAMCCPIGRDTVRVPAPRSAMSDMYVKDRLPVLTEMNCLHAERRCLASGRRWR
jgi:arginine deiminase